jgi:hypothetical protein
MSVALPPYASHIASSITGPEEVSSVSQNKVIS